MLLVEHSAILATFIKLPFVIKIFVLSIFEWPYYTSFSVLSVVEKIHVGFSLSWSLAPKTGFLAHLGLDARKPGPEVIKRF